MQKPFFSIVIPTHNRAISVLRAIDSCLNQTFSDFEVIVVDDESTDDTVALVKAIPDHRVHLLSRKNGGAAAARNSGIKKASGRYIAFLDSDDQFLKTKLQCFHEHLMQSSCDMIYSQVMAQRADGVVWVKPPSLFSEGQDIYNYIFLERGCFYPSAVAVKAGLAKNHLFDESISFGDDDQFAIDLWREGILIEAVLEPLTLYDDRASPDRLSQSSTKADAERVSKKRYLDWVEGHKKYMPEKAYLAYRATVFSPYIVQQDRLQAAQEIWRAKRVGALSWLQSVRQVIQTFSPRLYRVLTDFVAKIFRPHSS